MPDDSEDVEVDEVEALILERLDAIVKEHIGKFSEEDLSKRLKHVLSEYGARISVNPTFNVPKGEAPIAQFEMTPRFDVPQAPAPAVIVQAPSTELLTSIVTQLIEIRKIMRMPKELTVERDPYGRISKLIVQRSG